MFSKCEPTQYIKNIWTTKWENVPSDMWATSWQNQQNGMCAQRRLRSVWSTFVVRMKKLCILGHPRCTQILIRLCKWAGWSISSQGAHVQRFVFWRYDWYVCILSLEFVCVEVLRPSNSKGSCRARSIYLTTLLLGRFSPLLCTFFHQELITVLLEAVEERIWP